jgi:hypothetical protein
MVDNGQTLKLTSGSWYLDVTKGSIKRGPPLSTPSYYLSNAGNLICKDNKLYAQGFGMNNDWKKQVEGKKENQVESLKDAANIYYHKKVLHCYD